MQTTKAITAAFVITFIFSGPTRASLITARTPVSAIPTTFSANAGFTQGWEFTPTTNIIVDALGVFDKNDDGLASSHTMQIWTLGGTSLASASLTAGVHPLTNHIAFASISDLFLMGGTTYVASTFNGDAAEDMIGTVAGISDSPLITFDNQRRSIMANAFPTAKTPNFPVGVGATFSFAVPEPSSATLAISSLLLGGIGWVARHRRRRRKAA